jgi:hypothetical protein
MICVEICMLDSHFRIISTVVLVWTGEGKQATRQVLS